MQEVDLMQLESFRYKAKDKFGGFARLRCNDVNLVQMIQIHKCRGDDSEIT